MINSRLKYNTSKAFTIIEIVVIVTVVLILTTIITISYRAIVQDAHSETVRTDVQTAASAVHEYHNENGAYPESLESFTLPSTKSAIQYTANMANGTFCITATLEDTAWHVRSGNGRPQEGACS